MRKIASNDELMTTREAAEALGVAVRTVQLWVEAGVLTAWKTAGGHRRIPRAALEELLFERNKVMHPTAPESENSAPARNRRAVDTVQAPTAPPEVLKLLIVEDDPNIMRLYQMWVQSWNFKVDLTLVNNGYEGLLRIGQLRPDVVLTDLMMPGMDGFQLLRSLKSPNLGFDSLKLVVVSALSRQDIQNRGGLPEDVDIFEKPIPFDRIEAIVLQEVKQLTASRAKALAEADPLQQFSGALAGVFATIEFQRQHDVFQRVEAVEQLEGLKDETHVFGTDACALVFVEIAQALPGQDDFAAARQVEAGEQAEQGGFAGTGRADDGQAVALVQFQAEFVQDGQFTFRAGNHFAKVLRGENACAHGESDACVVFECWPGLDVHGPERSGGYCPDRWR